jgi:hypothetical protein
MTKTLCECCTDADWPEPGIATKVDAEGVPLCDDCYRALLADTYALKHPEEFD